MKFTESKYAEQPLESYDLDFGEFHFFSEFLVAEIASGTMFDWKKAQIIVELADQIYPADFAPYYISNKINSYSVDPTIWLKFLQNRRAVKAYLIVEKNRTAKFNLIFEQRFFTGKIMKFSDIEEAIGWVIERPIKIPVTQF